jgi:hypothetical protein
MSSTRFPFVVGTAVTTAVLFCGINTSLPPYPLFYVPSGEGQISIDHGIASSLDRYTLIPHNIEQRDNIEVIHNFAVNLLDNIEDIPPKFSEAVDAHFWDLI